MTIMKRCPHPDCHSLVPINNRDCGDHGDPGHKCGTGGCKTIIYGKLVYCTECNHDRRKKSCSTTRKNVTNSAVEIEVAKPWKRKTEPPRDMTPAEIRAWEKMIKKGQKELDELAQQLNPVLLAARKCQGAIVSLPVI